MNPPVRLLSLCCWLAVSIGIQRADAQWLTQTLNLKAGWNAVFLHVDASHAPIDALLAADPNASIEEIWLWNPDPSTQQFVQSPQEPTGGGPQWMTWTRSLGDSSPLQKLVPNAACLVRVRNEIPAYAWQLKGKPVVPRYQWTTSGLNFLGFPTAPVSPPSFEDFLAQAPSEFQRNAEVYRYPGGDLGPGNPMRVFALRATPVTRGEAYWIRSGEIYNRYYGPFEVVSAGAGAVAFGSTLRAISLRLRNLSPSDLTVTLDLRTSEAPPEGGLPPSVPPLLLRGTLNPTNLTYGYTPLTVGGPVLWTLAPAGGQGSEVEVVLGLDRSTLTGAAGDALAGILTFTDSHGQSQVDVGVSAEVGTNSGLWVGSAAVTEVGHYLKTYARDPNNALIVSSEGSYVPVGTNTSLGSVPSTYPLRLIVHNPATGPATLFQRVFVGFDGASNAIVANQEAPLNRNLLGEARRISASHLPFSSANTGWTFSGPLPPGGAVTTSVTNRFDNRSSNPFLHTYHPDHDNLDVHFTTELAQGSESYTVVRDITLDVQPPADDFASRTAAAQTVVGEYAETIRLLGLARPGNTFDTRAFQVRGSFSLNRIADIPTVTRTP